MSIRPTRLGHVVLRVRDVKRSERFYTDILGLESKGWIDDKAVFLRSDPTIDHDLALFEVGEDAPVPEDGGVGLYHFAYELESFDDLQEAYETVLENDVDIAGYGDHGDTKGLYLRDPDGNEVELYAVIPGSEVMALEQMLEEGFPPPT